MARFVIRRLFLIPPALLVINFLGYAYAYLVGPVQASANPYSTLQANIPAIWNGYGAYLSNLLHFDLGVLPVSEQPISEALLQAGQASLGLLAISITFSILLGLLLGFLAVRFDPPRTAAWLTPLTTIGLASPGFFIGILLITLALAYLYIPLFNKPLFPFMGFGWDGHLILPVVALMVRPLVQIAQVTSALMVEELSKQYVITARSLGNTWSVIRRKHVLRNILAGVILAISGSLRFMVAELIIVERLVSWPGLGRMLSMALVSTSKSPLFMDPPTLAALLTVLAVFFLLVELLASTLIRLADPRLRRPQAA
jgi:peptide/nickel transport system permease protein